MTAVLTHDDPDRLLTAKEAAALCSLSVYTFNDKVRRGLIRKVDLGGKRGVRYRRPDVVAFIEAHLTD